MKPDWITLDKTSGTGGGQIRVTAFENKSTSQRAGHITVSTNGGKSEILTITQNGVVYQEELNFEVTGENTDNITGYSKPCRKIIRSTQILAGVQVVSFIVVALKIDGPTGPKEIYKLEGNQSTIPIGQVTNLSPDMYDNFQFFFALKSTTSKRASIKLRIDYEDGSFYEHTFLGSDPH